MDDVEARGEGLLSSILRAIARNLDMARTGRPSSTEQGLVMRLINKRAWIKRFKGIPELGTIKRATNCSTYIRQ